MSPVHSVPQRLPPTGSPLLQSHPSHPVLGLSAHSGNLSPPLPGCPPPTTTITYVTLIIISTNTISSPAAASPRHGRSHILFLLPSNPLCSPNQSCILTSSSAQGQPHSAGPALHLLRYQTPTHSPAPHHPASSVPTGASRVGPSSSLGTSFIAMHMSSGK